MSDTEPAPRIHSEHEALVAIAIMAILVSEQGVAREIVELLREMHMTSILEEAEGIIMKESREPDYVIDGQIDEDDLGMNDGQFNLCDDGNDGEAYEHLSDIDNEDLGLCGNSTVKNSYEERAVNGVLYASDGFTGNLLPHLIPRVVFDVEDIDE